MLGGGGEEGGGRGGGGRGKLAFPVLHMAILGFEEHLMSIKY